ncbi:MAG TPA: glycine betaine ABC transporter substrate-binding protein [Kofleriaceae bacterium]|nr:glycine betaine ABC transporter substrate-binding protein [Kofleriaceae bacterium]
MRHVVPALACVALLAGPAAAGGGTVTVGSKNFTEQLLLGELIAQVIEHQTDLDVERRFNLAGTQFAFDALRAGDIDVYPEYTGTGLILLLGEPPLRDREALFRRISTVFPQRFGLEWRQSLGFSNTYALAVRRSDERLRDVTTISQLVARAGALEFGTNHEFLERPDGFQQLQEFYGMPIPADRLTSMDPGLMYSAIRDGDVDVIAAFATDGRIDAFDLRLLEDDLHFFPSYEAAPLVRQAALREHPALGPALDRLAGVLTDAEMRRLNHAVDHGGRPVAEVAQEFLHGKGLAPEVAPGARTSSDSNFWSYAWASRAEVWRLLQRHLFLTLCGLLAAMALAIPLGIALTRFRRLAGPVFGVINVVQTIPSLALLGFLIPILGIGVTPAIVALFLYGLLPLVRNTFTGISQIDPSLVEGCRGMGLTDMQILRKAELPLAVPIIMAGVRTSAVVLVGTATLAALIGAGGLGEPILRGVSSVNSNLILLGAMPAAVLAVVLDRGLHFVERRLTSRGLRIKRGKEPS